MSHLIRISSFRMNPFYMLLQSQGIGLNLLFILFVCVMLHHFISILVLPYCQFYQMKSNPWSVSLQEGLIIYSNIRVLGNSYCLIAKLSGRYAHLRYPCIRRIPHLRSPSQDRILHLNETCLIGEGNHDFIGSCVHFPNMILFVNFTRNFGSIWIISNRRTDGLHGWWMMSSMQSLPSARVGLVTYTYIKC